MNTRTVAVLICFTVFCSGSILGCRKQIIDSTNPPQEIVKPTVQPTPPSTLNPEMPSDLYPEATRQVAPDFDLPMLDDSGTLALSSLKGKMVLLDFTTTWCVWCDRQLPQVEDLFKNYKEKGFTVIAVDCREPKETVLQKYPGGKNPYPVVLDLDGSVSSNLFNVQGYPFYMLIDKNGKVAYVQSGYKENMYETVSKILDHLINKEP